MEGREKCVFKQDTCPEFSNRMGFLKVPKRQVVVLNQVTDWICYATKP